MEQGRTHPRPFGSIRGAALVLVIGVVALIVWWLIFINGALVIPRFSTTGPVVRNGVAVIVACGNASGGVIKGMTKAVGYAPEPQTGTWGSERKGECTVWYHRPPGLEQREARHQRAQQ